jgi:hypothetical protein
MRDRLTWREGEADVLHDRFLVLVVRLGPDPREILP